MPQDENQKQDEEIKTEEVVLPEVEPEISEKLKSEEISVQQETAPIESAVVETPAVELPVEQTPPEPPQTQVIEKIIYQTPPQPKADVLENKANFIQNLLIKARAKIQERKRKKLDKIMAIFEAKESNLPAGRRVTNRDVQKLLRISSATAVRYLDILERENRIKQVGNTGKAVFYNKI